MEKNFEATCIEKLQNVVEQEEMKFGVSFGFFINGEERGGIQVSYIPFTPEKIDMFKQEIINQNPEKIIGPYLYENPHFSESRVMDKSLRNQLSNNNHKYGISFGFMSNDGEFTCFSNTSNESYTPEKIEDLRQQCIKEINSTKIIGPYLAENPHYKPVTSSASGCLTFLLVPLVIIISSFYMLVW